MQIQMCDFANAPKTIKLDNRYSCKTMHKLLNWRPSRGQVANDDSI